jgi:hypothetical protein
LDSDGRLAGELSDDRQYFTAALEQDADILEDR